jgi:hypothetical protein
MPAAGEAAVSEPPASSRARGLSGLAVLLLIALATPVVIPLANVLQANRLPATYLPALEGPRERGRFETHRLAELRYLQPGYVVIGDSMAGTRIDERRLGELAGTPVAPLLQAGSGSAFWYLVLKNWVIASGIKPRMVLIFFRDTNLTDLMFRLDPQFRWALDLAAGEREDELNAVIARRLGPLHRIHGFLDRTVGVEQARRAAEPALTTLPATLMIASRRRRAELLTQLNVRLGLDHLRPMTAADIQIDDAPDFDFARDVEESVLPLMLRDAGRAGLTLCFVRVQRRPSASRPPEQSPALRRYVAALSQYVTARGAVFRDDTGDPAMTLDLYEDGDHIARHAKRQYTEILYSRLRPHFQ